MLPPILHLNYPLDIELLLSEAEKAKELAVPYVNPRDKVIPRNGWKVHKYASEYIKHISDELGVITKPRFFWLAADEILKPHTDVDTLCAVNFILSGSIAPITIEGINYTYSQALLNTQRRHGVINGPEERILLKLSIFENTFDELYEKFINSQYVHSK